VREDKLMTGVGTDAAVQFIGHRHVPLAARN
jgi:hypothetical protein